MEYRNSGNASHLGKGMAFSVDSDNGIENLGSTIQAISDTLKAPLTIRAKGTDTLALGDSSNVVFINGSTTPFKLVCGISSWTPPAMSSLSIDLSTFTMGGVSTGDLIVSVDFRGLLSTKYTPGAVTPSSAGEATVQLANPTKSTVSGSSGRVRWAYIDRT